MAYQNQLHHLKIEGYTSTEKYVSPKMGNTPPLKERDRYIHGNKIKNHLINIQNEFEALKEIDLPENIVRDDAIYVEFISEFNFELAFDSLHSDKKQPEYQILNIKKETVNDDVRFRVNVMLTEGGISKFINKANEYLNDNTVYKGQETQTPKNNKLISNIETIQLSTLQAFWTESIEIPFPEQDQIVWWEVWFRKKENEDNHVDRIIKQLEAVGASITEQELSFPEHYIRLIKASSKQLSESLLLLDNLAEIRKPKETADFFTGLTISEKEDAIEELKNRIENNTNKDSIAICLLDSGVQNKHPLLNDFTPDSNLYSWKLEEWGTSDGWPNGGHGTGMAGLALYGDLTDAMSTLSPIQIYHQIESVKIYNNNDPSDPLLYGRITEEATSSPIVDSPYRPRIYCMAVTDKCQAYYGRPSSWSAAIDKIIFGNEELELQKELFFVSSGNVVLEKPEDYPDKNIYESIHDPAQAFNAITVGSYTNMEQYDEIEFPNAKLIAAKGGMSPSNSTSLLWEKDWAIKPDIVMEGGNLINQLNDIAAPDSLYPLSTHKDFRTNYFQTFGDTSGATALASRFAALLKIRYPDLWNETIRGLIVHSSDWTPVMLNDKNIIDVRGFSKEEKQNLLRTFGYGVPNLEKALYSAQNSLTLIAEREIKPYIKEGTIKFNEIHLFELPWPTDILQNVIGDLDVKINITLSYFIEPNPGSRKYSNKFSYQSHGLRFNVIKPHEDLETFKKRVNKNSREDGESGFSGEDWIIKEQYRNKGSIHRDFWIASGADLSTRNCIAVYPTSGWYKFRKKLERYDSTVRYSLIVSIETSEIDVDIYTPIKNIIPIEV